MELKSQSAIFLSKTLHSKNTIISVHVFIISNEIKMLSKKKFIVNTKLETAAEVYNKSIQPTTKVSAE